MIAPLSRYIARNTTNDDVKGSQSVSLLTQPITLRGSKSFAHTSLPVPPAAFPGKDTLKLTYDLNGLCLLPGKASEISLIRGTDILGSLELSAYGENCASGSQSVDIPIAAFISNPEEYSFVENMDVSLWHPASYSVDITGVIVYFSGGSILGTFSEPTLKKDVKSTEKVTPLRPSPYAPYPGNELLL